MASDVSTTRSGGSSDQHTPELKARIVDAATTLFAERGWQGTHVRDVAREAGCTKPALYYHFESKEALFLACVRRQVARLRERHRIAHQAGTARERLIAAIRFITTYAKDDPDGLRFMFRASRQPEEMQPPYDYDREREEEVDLMRQAIDHGIAAGELRADLDAALASELVTNTVEARLVRFFATGEEMRPRGIERLVDTLYRGFAT
jgi:AcrR family transcriptional regulator